MNRNPYSSSINALSALKSTLKYVKAEFEAEGTRSEELSLLKSIVSASSSELVIKIGGSFAQRDLLESINLRAMSTLVPMIESPEAMNLFIQRKNSLQKYISSNIPFFINIETITAYQKLDLILDIASQDPSFSGIVIGRSDLTASLSLSKTSTESSDVFDICSDILKSAKKRNISVTLGGNISFSSFSFLQRLANLGLDAFETRKCCLSWHSPSKEEYSNLIKQAIDLESSILLCYQNLSSIYTSKLAERLNSISARKQ
jgi:hypothetical protein